MWPRVLNKIRNIGQILAWITNPVRDSRNSPCFRRYHVFIQSLSPQGCDTRPQLPYPCARGAMLRQWICQNARTIPESPFCMESLSKKHSILGVSRLYHDVTTAQGQNRRCPATPSYVHRSPRTLGPESAVPRPFLSKPNATYPPTDQMATPMARRTVQGPSIMPHPPACPPDPPAPLCVSRDIAREPEFRRPTRGRPVAPATSPRNLPAATVRRHEPHSDCPLLHGMLQQGPVRSEHGDLRVLRGVRGQRLPASVLPQRLLRARGVQDEPRARPRRLRQHLRALGR